MQTPGGRSTRTDGGDRREVFLLGYAHATMRWRNASRVAKPGWFSFRRLSMMDVPSRVLNDMPVAASKKSDVLLTQASPDDLDRLVSIRIEAMRESLERLGRFDPVRARHRFVDGFDASATRRIELSGMLVGFVVLKTVGDEWLLDHLYVTPRAQGGGIGSEVLSRIVKEADEAGKPIRVGALKESDSNRFYVRHGFVHVGSGEFDNYYVRVQEGMDSR